MSNKYYNKVESIMTEKLKKFLEEEYKNVYNLLNDSKPVELSNFFLLFELENNIESICKTAYYKGNVFVTIYSKDTPYDFYCEISKICNNYLNSLNIEYTREFQDIYFNLKDYNETKLRYMFDIYNNCNVFKKIEEKLYKDQCYLRFSDNINFYEYCGSIGFKCKNYRFYKFIIPKNLVNNNIYDEYYTDFFLSKQIKIDKSIIDEYNIEDDDILNEKIASDICSSSSFKDINFNECYFKNLSDNSKIFFAPNFTLNNY